MLFPYTYVPHQMDTMQVFIDFIFFEVWCKAPAGAPFSTDLFSVNHDLHEVMIAFQWGDTAGGDFFYSHVERIYGLFAALNPAQIDQFQQWYQGNNDLEKVCANDPVLQLARYADIAVNYNELSEQLAIFFKGLYSPSLLSLVVLRDKIGNIEDHYQNLMQANAPDKCPFCGIGDIKSTHHSRREAYDHYLPKALYPFNSINFHNLAPACHECNSTYKLSKDPLNSDVGRRKAFYPYSNTQYSIELGVVLKKHSDVERLTPNDVTLKFGPSALNEEIDTWKDVYGIEERYKAKCCSADAKDWLEQIRILKDTLGIEPNAYLIALQQQAVKAPFANNNFLKKAYLEGCQRAGIFNAIAQAI